MPSRPDRTRIYVLEATNGKADERLMRAANKSRAVRGSARARLATQDDLQRLLAAGVVVETEGPVRRSGAAKRPAARKRLAASEVAP